jgi:hypothetical protein
MQMNLPAIKGQPMHKASDLTTICEQTVWEMREHKNLKTLQVSTASHRDSFTFSSLHSLPWAISSHP